MKFPRLSRYRIGGSATTMKLGVPVPRTPDGRAYRYSPNADAHPRHFVIGEVVADVPLTDELRQRMKQDPRAPKTVCPYSGTVADDAAFIHPEDEKAAIALVKHEALQDIQDAFTATLRNAVRGSKHLRFTAPSRSPRPKPRFARRDLMRELVCDHCGRDYGVYAIGLFCPDCGAPNLRLHFAREKELVDQQVSIAEDVEPDSVELAYRLLGNAHEDVLTAFEATLKAVYVHAQAEAGTTPAPKVGNDFQNVEKARKRFAELNLDPFADLNSAELAVLELNIQKRHIIGHNLGIVDDRFAARAAAAKVGETVHLVGDDIRQFAAIGQRVVDALDGWLGGTPSPTIDQAPLLVSLKEPIVHPEDPKNLMGLDLQLSLLARKVAVWVAEQDGDGLRDFVETGRLREAFKDSSDAELEEAIAELQVDDFIEQARGFGDRLPAFRPTLDLYLTFDGLAFGRDPTADIVTVSELVLEGPDSVSAEAIFSQTGWDARRFNPAFAYIALQIPDGRVSKSLGTGFAVQSFHMLPEDRVQIRRLAARLGA